MRGRALVGALLMAALVLLYVGVALTRAAAFVGSGRPIGVGIGLALAVLPVIGLAAVLREIVFGAQADRIVRRLDEEGGLPDVPRRASGRPDRDAARTVFDAVRAEAEADPESWRAQLRLGLAYDAAGDRRRARAAVRRAIGSERGAR